MTFSSATAVLLAGVCLLADSHALATEPDTSTMSVVPLPTQRTAVYVWPIMRGCKPDKAATDAVVRQLSADLRLAVHRLRIPEDPAFLRCLGTSCAELLDREGCEKRNGVLVGGEIDEATCDASERSVAGCRGQVFSRIRVFRFDLEQNQPVRGDFRYSLCQDQRCGTDAGPVEDASARLIEQLVAVQNLTSPPALPRTSPESAEVCAGQAPAAFPSAAVVAPSAPEVAAPESAARALLFAHYTQYRHLDGSYPSRGQAEQAARNRATHFADGMSIPDGLQPARVAVNGKSALLPGEEVLGNFARATTLHGFLINPPAGPEYELVRKVPVDQRMMIILVLDDETKALSLLVIEPNKALRQVTAPSACQAGGGESAACLSAAVRTALGPAPAAREVTPPIAAGNQRPLGCLPFAERSASACGGTSAPAESAALVASQPQVEESSARRLSERLLYAAMGVAVATAGALTIADSVLSPNQLSDSLGNTVYIDGLLRPAVWTAWGLSIGLAIPTVVSVFENKARQREIEATRSTARARALRCPIREDNY